MIEIITQKGEVYSFNPDTERIFKDGQVIPSLKAEPIYSDSKNDGKPPRFSGILFKDSNQILSLSGKLNPITDPNTIS